MVRSVEAGLEPAFLHQQKTMFKPKIVILVTATTLIASATAGYLAYHYRRNLNSNIPLTSKLPRTDANRRPSPPPDLHQLAAIAMNGGASAPTPEQLKEEADMQKSQVETAGEWLHSPDMQQRVEGAEQLTAYPTRDAEKLLN